MVDVTVRAASSRKTPFFIRWLKGLRDFYRGEPEWPPRYFSHCKACGEHEDEVGPIETNGFCEGCCDIFDRMAW